MLIPTLMLQSLILSNTYFGIIYNNFVLLMPTLALLTNQAKHHRFSSKRLNNKGTIGLIIIFKVV